MEVRLEVRPNLGVIEVEIRGQDFEAVTNVIQVKEVIKLVVEDKILTLRGLKELPFEDEDELGFCQTLEKGVLSLRIQAKNKNAKVLRVKGFNFRPWSVLLTKSPCMDDDWKVERPVEISCAFCHLVLSSANFTIKRCLPLPSMTKGKEMFDFFCCCNPAAQNRPPMQVQARSGDVLFAPGFVCLRDCDVTGTREEESVIFCASCDQEIGLEEDGLKRYWQHCLRIGTKEKKPTVTDTVIDIFNGLMRDSWIPCLNVRFVGTKRDDSLSLMALLQQADKYEGASDDSTTINMHPVNMTKVMYQESDVDMSPNPIVFRLGDSLLQRLKDLVEERNWTKNSSGVQTSYLSSVFSSLSS